MPPGAAGFPGDPGSSPAGTSASRPPAGRSDDAAVVRPAEPAASASASDTAATPSRRAVSRCPRRVRGSRRSSPASTGASGPACGAGSGGRVASAASVAIAVLRAYGERPSTAACSVAPSDHMSASTLDTPSAARSGATYWGEPRTRPGRVIAPSPPWNTASPKSVSSTRPSRASSTFAGFTSRCSTPASCAARSAASTDRPISAARPGGSGPSVSMISWSERDGTYSMISQGSPWTRTTS